MITEFTVQTLIVTFLHPIFTVFLVAVALLFIHIRHEYSKENDDFRRRLGR